MSQQLVQVAMTNLSLVKGSDGARSVLHDVAEVTGLPLPALVQAQRLVAKTGSLTPLEALFESPAAQAHGGLRYRIVVRRTNPTPRTADDHFCRVMLELHSQRGKMRLAIDARLARRAATPRIEAQMAKLSVSFCLEKDGLRRSWRQQLTRTLAVPRLAAAYARVA